MNFTKTILNGVREWIYANFLSFKSQSLSSTTQEQVRINIGETDDRALELAYDTGLVEPLTEDGFILTDEDNNILSN